MKFVKMPLVFAVVGFIYGFSIGGLPNAFSYAIGFFVGGFTYRVLRHLLIINIKKTW
ncbi:hypothetical protein [Pseudalkalibacillus berkeleyi]|uniref:Uncharacterized protein n=1 Tax=Pseudalkalibacillus berkeleyi TaxID=1069813 RepID=A0ABS9H5V7_9BACL|nr:hypothetical protein [Pseudalkalibacillus berkeleyi]MCF6139175.1 hypothetical protein [Pseudalkalibacillus berkeleyi]